MRHSITSFANMTLLIMWGLAMMSALPWVTEGRITSPSSSGLLTCACDTRYYCQEETCETDGMCFVSLTRSKRDPEKIEKSFRCLDQAFLIPPQRPIVCEYNHNQNHTYVSKCCKGSDFCNIEMDIQLAPLPTSASAGSKDQAGGSEGFEINLQILLAIAIPVVILVFLLPLVYVFTRRNVFPCCMMEACCQEAFYHEVDSIETQSTYPCSSINDYLSFGKTELR